PDERELLSPALVDVAIERVLAGVQLAAGEPAVEGFPGAVEHAVPLLPPADAGGDAGPETLRIGQRPAVGLLVDAHRCPRRGLPLLRMQASFAAAPQSGAAGDRARGPRPPARGCT